LTLNILLLEYLKVSMLKVGLRRKSMCAVLIYRLPKVLFFHL